MVLSRIELVRAQIEPADRIVLNVVLDPAGAIDIAAFLADPTPWPFQRGSLNGELIRVDESWALRAGSTDDAPLWLVQMSLLRPGESAFLRSPAGEESTFVVVAVT